MDWETFYKAFRQPDFVAGYEIQNRLGGGAFGEVYKARKHSIGKPYAIKFLKMDDSAQMDVVKRELEQVRHFAAIDHPNLVTIEDMGMVLDVPYLVMGYAGEQTLAKRMARGELDRRTALSYFVQACRGVLALHDRRLVHFDLKPGNIFIHGDVARVGDYGLAKLMTEGRLTLSFGRGTPHYMAPEMLRGRADHRSDIYSLGVILYESIAGKVPFEAESSSGIVIRSEERGPEFPDDFPADLREVTERCLRVNAADRYETVAELLGALGQSARRGDSIRIDHLPAGTSASLAARAHAPAGEPVRPPDAPPEPRSGEVTPTARQELAQGAGELRSTAAEFARGAVEVARGVWDGLKTPRGADSSSRIPDPGPSADRFAGGGGAPLASGASASAPAPAVASGPHPAFGSAVGGGTIPVPPRASGGILGALKAAVVLAVEVFLSLVRGIFRWLRGGFALARGRVHTENSSLLWKIARLSVFFLFLTVLGGFIMVVLLAVLGIPFGR